jgi:hypothetical protein
MPGTYQLQKNATEHSHTCLCTSFTKFDECTCTDGKKKGGGGRKKPIHAPSTLTHSCDNWCQKWFNWIN